MKYLKYMIYTVGTISAITVAIGWIPALALAISFAQTGRMMDGGAMFLYYFSFCVILQAVFFENYKG